MRRVPPGTVVRATVRLESTMPISIAQVFDLLLALILVMFVPIGLWRGALREWIALAGIGLGAALAAEWSAPWGGDLADLYALDPRMARFAVGALLFLGTTLVVGYGAGLALPYRPDLTWPNRVLGAAFGLGNGLLILSHALRTMQRTLFDDAVDSPLLGSTLARFLIDYVGWVVLGLLLALVGTVLASAGRRWTNRSPLLEEYAPVYYADWGEWVDADGPEEARDDGLLAPELVDRAGLVTWRAGKADANAEEGDEEVPAHAQQTAVLRAVPPPGGPDEADGAGEESPEPERPAEAADTAGSDAPANVPPAPPSPPPMPIPAAVREAPADAAPAVSARRVIELARPAATAAGEAAVQPGRRPDGEPEATQPAASAAPSDTPAARTVVQLPRVPRPPAGDDQPTLPRLPRRPPGPHGVNGNGSTPSSAPAPHHSAAPAAPAPARPEVVCGNCRSSVAAGARVCPTCGYLIGEAERRSIRATSNE